MLFEGEEYEEVEGPDGEKIIKRKGKRIRLTKPGEPEKPGEEDEEEYEEIEGPNGEKVLIKRKGKIIRYKMPGKPSKPGEPGEPEEPGEEPEEDYEEYEVVKGPNGKKTIKPKGKTIRLKLIPEKTGEEDK